MSGPLAGLKIIEIAGIGPGPFTAMLLADMGADVVRIDRAQNVSGGDPGHATGERLTAVAGRWASISSTPTASRRSSPSASRPTASSRGSVRVMERLGLGPARCSPATRARVRRMTAGDRRSVLGLGRPRHQLHRASAPSDRADRPSRPGARAAAEPGGRLRRRRMFLAFGMVCGLLNAQRGGEGQVVDAAMVDGAATLMTMFHAMTAMGVWNEGAARTCSTPAPTSTTCTRPPTASTCRSVRSSRSSTPS